LTRLAAHCPAAFKQMLFIIAGVLLVVVVGVVSFRRVVPPGGLLAGTLGSMSEQWLAEHRAGEHAS
jgi:hypothetical protein